MEFVQIRFTLKRPLHNRQYCSLVWYEEFLFISFLSKKLTLEWNSFLKTFSLFFCCFYSCSTFALKVFKGKSEVWSFQEKKSLCNSTVLWFNDFLPNGNVTQSWYFQCCVYPLLTQYFLILAVSVLDIDLLQHRMRKM